MKRLLQISMNLTLVSKHFYALLLQVVYSLKKRLIFKCVCVPFEAL